MGKQATPALDVAVRAGIAHHVHKYDHDPAHESFGAEAAEKLGRDPGTVFKTLIVSFNDRLGVGVVPVDKQLDLKAFASAVGAKSAAMADMDLAERTTGYIVGAISPLGQKKRLTTVIDESAFDYDMICVSAGKRGLEIELRAGDLESLTGGKKAAIAR